MTTDLTSEGSMDSTSVLRSDFRQEDLGQENGTKVTGFVRPDFNPRDLRELLFPVRIFTEGHKDHEETQESSSIGSAYMRLKKDCNLLKRRWFSRGLKIAKIALSEPVLGTNGGLVGVGGGLGTAAEEWDYLWDGWDL